MARPLTCYGTFGMSIVQRVQPPKAALIAGRAIRQGYPSRVGQLKEADGKPLTVADRNFIQGI